MVDPGEPQVGEGQPLQPPDGFVGVAPSAGHVGEELAERRLVHQGHYPARE